MLTPGFNQLGQAVLHFGTSLDSRIQPEALVDCRAPEKRGIAGLINCGIVPSSMRGPGRETGSGIAPAQAAPQGARMSSPPLLQAVCKG
jgi:hypothetical protein